MSDDHLFRLAREASFDADYTGSNAVRIGCVVVYKGSVLARGHNSDKTHTAQKQYNKWRFKNSGNTYLPSKCHAEICALSKIKYLDIDFSKVHIYVYREFANGSPANSRPCPSCQAALHNMKIIHWHYTTNGGYVYEKRAD